MTETRPLRSYAEVILGRQRSPLHESGAHMVPYLRAANVTDGALNLDDVKEMNFSPAEQQAFSLQPGDVLVTEGSGSLRAVGASAVWNGELPGPVCFQNTLLRLRPRPATDPRFLAWWCRFAFADGLFASVSTGANIYHLSAERVRALPMTYLSLPLQRRVADFLDRETARIDALVAAKRRMTALLDEESETAVSCVVWSGVASAVPLKRRVQPSRPIMYGIVLPGPDVPFGVPIVKGGDVAGRRLDPALLNRTTAEIELPYARARLAPGDLVFAIRGGIGDVEVVPQTLAGANITQDVARVAPAHDVESEWLRLVLRSHQVRFDVARRTTGATIRGLNIADLKEIRVPSSDLARQADDLRSLIPRLLRIDRMRVALARQIDLLTEHRQALIRAAVTGELSVPGVAA